MMSNKTQTGFTLLELLMVVSIMSATAYVALSKLDNDGNNLRYQSTTSHLKSVRQAIIGLHLSSTEKQGLQSGYVIDNGRLPAIDTTVAGTKFYGINDLTHQPTGFLSYGQQAPRFDSSPDTTTGINNSAGTVLNTDKQILLKGYRDSAYLNLKPGASRFKDGWNNDWVTTRVTDTSTGLALSDTWQIVSYGLNNKPTGIEPFDTDVTQKIYSDSWQVDLAGWQVQVSNQSGSDISVTRSEISDPAQCLRLSLLVFVNSNKIATPNQQWKRLTSSCIAGNTVTDSCLDGDGDGDADGDSAITDTTNVCPSTSTVTFPIQWGGIGNYQPSTKIPQGEHLLVLLKDIVATDAHIDESESIYTPHVTQKVRFYAGVTRPDVTLVIR